jgi:hypothetical protein
MPRILISAWDLIALVDGPEAESEKAGEKEGKAEQ